MAYKLKTATKLIKPMKVLMYGPMYSGKTYGSLLLAVGIVQKIRKCSEEDAYKHIILIDTEYRRGALYNKLGAYNYDEIKAPYYTEKLVDLVRELNTIKDIDVIIVDSLTHFWVKEGGILDQKAIKDKDGGNSYTNWIEYTTKFNKMIDCLLQSPKSIIATARAKSDTVLEENAKGKMVPITYGLKPELREGVEYDFDLVVNVDKTTHNLIIDKGVPGITPVYDTASPETGGIFYDLFNADAIVAPRTEADVMASIRRIAQDNNMIREMQLKLSGRKLDAFPMDKLIDLEKELLADIKAIQHKHKSN